MSELLQASVDLIASIDAEDIVKGLGNNDEAMLAFILQMLEKADSSELRERLAERLRTWEEDHDQNVS